MRRDPRLEIITETIEHLIPGATPANLTVKVSEPFPRSASGVLAPGENSWTGSPAGLAERIFTALYGRPKAVDDRSPLAQAEDAKRARDLVGEVGALMQAGTDLESAPWYPVRRGDVVCVHYEQAGDFPPFGETYVVDDAGDGLLGLKLVAHSLPEGSDAEGMVGCFAVEAMDCPIYDLWFEAGPQRLTIVRDGRVIHRGESR